ncbi:YbhB/YbcL family Raf kinase inhibitor-like protein [Streptomyces ficellus]|uniref:YbhB/YbcL family Raf kinase inhibitor-like protein n=1 Tax=Streptomyces ficellus TaxID=1977088 RepID=A0ABT7Z130_9ACTN|nr:YbhB/YbcL family Raf kinase inhibitor-like protein [Streptomyces ficellus]MDN3293207.1 YbhB/YbcL family Raf kinase inhibitor-like protein [Streptomyces ficellus]
MAGIELKSTAFDDGAFIPRRYTKDGEDLSPQLTWTGVPDGTAELLLLCEDPDAPMGTFVHWLVTGIDPTSEGVEAGRTPPGGQPRTNGFGDPGWGGPRPPAGDPVHRYFFRLYALAEPVPLPDGAGAEDVHAAVDARHLATGTLMGLYQR